jgi:pyridoxal phosphate enzyme (YggS family)
MPDAARRIVQNVQAVRERIAAAARACGRAADDITLVAVTKYVGIDEVRALIAAGCLDLGESRPQELWRKAEEIADPRVHWHLVGHLQRNKARRTLPVASLVHSVDSLRLLAAIDEESRSLSRKSEVLLEVNVSGDATKHGFATEEMSAVVGQLTGFPHVRVRGLMTMASREGDLDVARRDFARLRTLRDELQSDAPPGIELAQLSMGMSGDLEAAIAEGATIVRVGSALFEGLDE